MYKVDYRGAAASKFGPVPPNDTKPLNFKSLNSTLSAFKSPIEEGPAMARQLRKDFFCGFP